MHFLKVEMYFPFTMKERKGDVSIGWRTRIRSCRKIAERIIMWWLIGLMYKQADSIAMVGKVIGYIFGAVLILMGLFRKYISVYMMKNNPEVHVNEEITYLFGNTGIRADKPQEGTEEHLANYKEVYCVWEDEADFYLGMNNDDLIVLQKANFTTGEASLFKDFILEKSGAKYIWKPAKFVNVCKNAVLKAKIRATQMQMAADQDGKEEK